MYTHVAMCAYTPAYIHMCICSSLLRANARVCILCICIVSAKTSNARATRPGAAFDTAGEKRQREESELAPSDRPHRLLGRLDSARWRNIGRRLVRATRLFLPLLPRPLPALLIPFPLPCRLDAPVRMLAAVAGAPAAVRRGRKADGTRSLCGSRPEGEHPRGEPGVIAGPHGAVSRLLPARGPAFAPCVGAAPLHPRAHRSSPASHGGPAQARARWGRRGQKGSVCVKDALRPGCPFPRWARFRGHGRSAPQTWNGGQTRDGCTGRSSGTERQARPQREGSHRCAHAQPREDALMRTVIKNRGPCHVT